MKPVIVVGVFASLLILVQNRVDHEPDACITTNDVDAVEVTSWFGGVRNLLQTSQDTVFSVTTEEELRNVLSIASQWTEIRLDTTALTLSGPIVIDRQNMTLEGRADAPTVLTCPQNGNESAIVIRQASSVRLIVRLGDGSAGTGPSVSDT